MRVVFSGGEKGSYRSLLTTNGVKRIAINVTQLSVPKKKELNLRELVGDAEVYLYSSDGDEDVNRYDEVIRAHESEIDIIVGRPDYNGEWLGEKYYPLWNDPMDTERLAHLMQKYGRVAIADSAVTTKTSPRIRQLQQRWGASLLGITSKTDVIESIQWDIVLVASWTSVVRYGETQVWDGHGLRRYPAQQKESARRRHRADIVRMGVDFDSVMEDDVNEVAKLAVRSWLEWEMHTFGTSAYDPPERDDEDEMEEPSEGQVLAISPVSPPSTSRVSGGMDLAITPPEPRHEGKSILPVMATETMVHSFLNGGANPDESTLPDPDPQPLIRTSGRTIRSCDSCYLSTRCPAFKPGAECAYELPIELRTKDQLQAVIRAMLEMQTSRVMFASFAEQLEGQGMDPALSSEMDRLFRLIQASKDISDTRDLIRFEMEAKGSSGALSRIFGTKAGEKARELETPMTMGQLDQVILDAHVIE